MFPDISSSLVAYHVLSWHITAWYAAKYLIWFLAKYHTLSIKHGNLLRQSLICHWTPNLVPCSISQRDMSWGTWFTTRERDMSQNVIGVATYHTLCGISQCDKYSWSSDICHHDKREQDNLSPGLNFQTQNSFMAQNFWTSNLLHPKIFLNQKIFQT